jgi:hypothetical protein
MKTVLRLVPLALAMPLVTFAADPANLNSVKYVIGNITNFMNSVLIPFVFALAFMVFIWGMFKTFILGGSDEGKQEQGKSLMMYSIVGFVLMVSLWGIVNLFADAVGTKGETLQAIPVVPGTR